MKKLFAGVLCLLLLTGCGEKQEETIEVPVYDFDYIDYLDISFTGPNEYADLDIEIADFSVNDFDNESDYIAVKKIMTSVADDILATKDNSLSNGDIIQIYIGDTFDTSEADGVNINLGVHEITVSNLPAAKTLDLFGTDNITFYGLDGTDLVYYYFPSSSELSSEMKENLIYSIQIDDEEVEKDKTVLSLSCSVKGELLESNKKYGNDRRYFLANGYIAELSSERTLKNIVKEKDIEKAERKEFREVLEPLMKDQGEEYEFVQLMSIQKTEKPFEYYAVGKYVKGERELYIKFTTSLAYINKQINVLSFERDSSTDSKYATEAYSDAEILHTYEIFEITEETEESETTESK